MSADSILVVGPSWVGDMVMAQSLVQVLKAKAPNRDIDVLAPGWSLPIVARMPEVRRAVEMPLGHGALNIGVRREVGRRLRDSQYDRAIVLPRSAKAALAPWFARIPLRTGFRGEMRFGLINDMRPFDPQALDQTVKRFVFLGLDDGETLPPIPSPNLIVDREAQARAIERLVTDPDKPAVGLLPGAEYGPAKAWPAEHFAAAARALHERGYAVWLLGGPGDRDMAAEISRQAAVPIDNLCGETSLSEAIDLLAACRCVISNDSGLMHVAAAVQTHVVAIYGSSSPHFTPPLTSHKTIHYLDLECSPCFKRTCPLGHLRCLREVDPAMVVGGIDALGIA
ncbi:MAG: lipopolysaccharide heptosyltransferase II [Pseudomonadota bacterium]